MKFSLNVNQILNTLVTLIIFFAVLFGYTKLAGPLPFSVNSVTTTKSDTFQVTGEGKASVKPDMATVNFGVQAKGKTKEEVQKALNTNINKVNESIKALGIEEKDIKTQGYNIYPSYENEPKPLNVEISTPPVRDNTNYSSYQGSTNVEVKVRDISIVNAVVDAAVENGANQVGGVNFSNKDNQGAENEARKKAVEDARKKAQETAALAGFKLGKLLNYQENPYGKVYPMAERAMQAGDSAAGVPTQIEAGENEVTISVILSYEIQ